MTVTQYAHFLARENRKNATDAEKILWDILRGRKILGLKFLRQNPIFYKIDDRKKFFIADFHCYEKRIVIEVDGKIHKNQKDYDQVRTDILSLKNIKVIRVTNDEVLDENTNIINLIKQRIESILYKKN